MAEKPILFSAPMVRALLAGRKTQTRRIVKPQGKIMSPMLGRDDKPTGDWFISDPVYDRVGSSGHFPRYAVGDTLWVREAWALHRQYDLLKGSELVGLPEMGCLRYKADGPYTDPIGRPRHGMFMPRWASRLTLRVNLVRAQRVQDISHDDALAEGLAVDEDLEPTLYGVEGTPVAGWSICPIKAFACLWDAVNGEGAWERNDWVWAYTVEVIR